MTAYLSALLKNPIVATDGAAVGRLEDVIIQLRAEGYPLVTALVVRIGGTDVFVPAADIRSIESGRVELATAKLDVRPFSQRPGEVLLNQDVMGHRLVDTANTTLTHARDISLEERDGAVFATGIDVRRRRLFHHTEPETRDWKEFIVLIGHEGSTLFRRSFLQLRRLRPAQIADLIEDASAAERTELLGQVASDPDLEADVFEELDEDEVTRVLKTRTPQQVADALTHMQADDAVDALVNLPHEQRLEVLGRLPAVRRAAILALMSYQGDTAGGLMSVDQFSLPADTTVASALDLIRRDTVRQPQTLAVVFVLDADARLQGTVSLLQLVQADPGATLEEVQESEPVSVRATDDVLDVVSCMADYNLLVLPVVDEDGRLLGAITVDDALEAAIPQNWRNREVPRTTKSIPIQHRS